MQGDVVVTSAPILAEAELHEDWVSACGKDDEEAFHRFLDSGARRLRNWLVQDHKQPQAMREARQDIRCRKQ